MIVFLIGFMGSGKTTLGKYAAKQLGLAFVDLDQWIEAGQGLEVREIFKKFGEPHFRELERQALREIVGQGRNILVACGGGTPCFHDNMAFMNSSGITVYLDIGSARLSERLRHNPDKRPLLQSIQGDLQTFIHQKLLERAPFYAQAQYMVAEADANKQKVTAILRDILQ